MPLKNTNRGVAWLQSEVNALLDIWAGQEIQEQLAGRLHNMCIYEKISRKLKELGFNRTGEQCREKIKKLRRDYKTVLQKNYSPAYARRLLGFYDKVQRLFGNPWDRKSVASTEIAKSDSHFDNDAELSGESFTNSFLNKSDDFINGNVTEYFNSDIASIEQVHNNGERLSHENENTLQGIFQNCALLIETFTLGQRLLNSKFMELEKVKSDGEIERANDRLLFIENQRQKTKSQTFEMYNTLFQLLANKNESI